MNIIWVVLIFFIVSFISPGERCNKIFDFVQRKWNIFAWLERLKISRWYKISSVGWLLFSVYWFSLLSEYFEGDDYVNVVLTVLVGFLCILIAIRIIGDDKEGLWKSLTMWVTISGLIYLPFSEIPVLKDTLISIVTNQTVSLLELFGVHTQLVSATNTILLNGLSVEIVLGCTAIESMAFFAGLIFCVNAPLKRKLLAFIFVPIIYIANLFRNSFVIYAYGNQLFQFGVLGSSYESFFWAHNVIAKIFSLTIVIILAYATFKILPEFLSLIEEFIESLFPSEKRKSL